MIQVLERAFKILDYISKEPERAHPLGEIADIIDVNPSTCYHIIETLCENNYVEQVAPKKGYTLGITPYFLTRNGPYRKDLISITEPLMKELAKKINETIVLAVINHGKKYNLINIPGNQRIQINNKEIENISLSDIYSTATGILLMSHLEYKKIKKIIENKGLPKKIFPEITTKDNLIHKLNEISKQSPYINKDAEVVQIAFPLKKEKKTIAALGVSVPKYRFKENTNKIIGSAEETAKNINEILSK